MTDGENMPITYVKGIYGTYTFKVVLQQDNYYKAACQHQLVVLTGSFMLKK